jgi:anion-transporting  ArsA/GET3 family ATPase
VDPAQFFATSRLVIVAGKGGVGKTTVTATLARAASRAGLSSLIVEVEGKSGLAELFGHAPLTYEETELLAASPATGAGGVRARTLTPDDALLEYLSTHGMNRVSKRLVNSGALDVVSTAAPGIKDILILGKVKQLERRRTPEDGVPAPDLILLDAPAAGHAISFLRSAAGLVDAARVGPINAQAAEVLEMLTDGDRCQVVLVTLPEETPVNELVETAYSLEEDVGVKLGPVVVNGLYPSLDGLETPPAVAAEAAHAHLLGGEAEALAAAADFRVHRIALQAEQLERLDTELPLPQLHLPFCFTSELGLDELDVLAGALLDSIDGLAPLAGQAAP